MNIDRYAPKSSTHSLRVLRRRWRMAVLLAALVAAPAVILSLRTAPTFESSATLLIDPPGAPTPQSEVTDFLPSGSEFSAKTQVQLLQGIDITKRLAASLGGTVKDAASHKISVGKDTVSIDVKNPDETELLVVTASGPNAKLCGAAAGTLCDLYLDDLHRVAQTTIESTLSLVRDRWDTARRQLRRSQAAIRTLQDRYQVGAIDKDLDLQATAVNDLRGKKASSLADLAASRAAVSEAQMQWSAEPQTLLDPSAPETDPRILAAEKNLDDLVAQRTKMLQTFTSKHPDVIAADAEIRTLRSQLKLMRHSIAGQAVRKNDNKQELWQHLQTAQADLSAKLAYSRSVGVALASAEARLSKYPAWEVKFAEQSRLATGAAEDIERYRKVRDGLEFKSRSVDIHARVSDPASMPAEPAHSKRFLNIAVSLAIGLVFGCVAVLAAGVGNLRLSTPEDVAEWTGLRVVASLPPSSDDAMPAAAWLVLHSDLDTRGLVLAVASTEGAEHFAKDLALAVSTTGRNVLLVDAAKTLTGSAGGFSNTTLARSWADPVCAWTPERVPTEAPNLERIELPAGSASESFLGSLAFGNGVRSLRVPGRLVVVKAPSSDDASSLMFVANSSDVVLMAVARDEAKVENVLALHRILKDASDSICGVVLVSPGVALSGGVYPTEMRTAPKPAGIGTASPQEVLS